MKTAHAWMCYALLSLTFFSCSKTDLETPTAKSKEVKVLEAASPMLLSTANRQKAPKPSLNSTFTMYTLYAGQHYAEPRSALVPVSTKEMKFAVKFDNSAIYQNVLPENQYDINKLYGFSDNNAFHQQFSARIGWRWSDGALRLFAYVYNNGIRSNQELTSIPLNTEIFCSINVSSSTYTFMVNGEVKATMPRLSTTPLGAGYKLYPYFGGDETAPQNIYIWLKDL